MNNSPMEVSVGKRMQSVAIVSTRSGRSNRRGGMTWEKALDVVKRELSLREVAKDLAAVRRDLRWVYRSFVPHRKGVKRD